MARWKKICQLKLSGKQSALGKLMAKLKRGSRMQNAYHARDGMKGAPPNINLIMLKNTVVFALFRR